MVCLPTNSSILGIDPLKARDKVTCNINSMGPGRFGGVSGFFLFFTLALLLFLAIAGSSNPAGPII